MGFCHQNNQLSGDCDAAEGVAWGFVAGEAINSDDDVVHIIMQISSNLIDLFIRWCSRESFAVLWVRNRCVYFFLIYSHIAARFVLEK